jgi:hypothetical protein
MRRNNPMQIADPFPALPLATWQNTRDTLHLFLQIVGKIRLTLFPKKNHWWHVPLYVSVRGLTTGPIPYGGGLFELEFNFIDHTLDFRTSQGGMAALPLAGKSVPEFYTAVLETLRQHGIVVSILDQPYDMPDVPPGRFADLTPYHSYDPVPVATMWQILISVDSVFQQFRGRFIGKSTPVHLFWHHFDLALTRFSGRRNPPRSGISQVEYEAYSHEVISFGFWFGDANVPEPAFYAYGFPVAEGAYAEPLQPSAAFWSADAGMALLKYEDVRSAPDPRQAILDFLESSYRANAQHMHWDITAFQL